MTTAQKIIKTKVGILDLAKQLDNVSKACRIMGYSRDDPHGPGHGILGSPGSASV
jgi:hypothetical protein